MKRTLVATAAALLAITGSGAAAAVSHGGRGHRPHRPAGEHVPASVHAVHLARHTEPGSPAASAVRVTGKRAAALVRDFDHLRTVPSDAVHCDIAGGPERVVTFMSARHLWRVTQAACTDVQVSRDGKRLPALVATRAWNQAVARDLRRGPGPSASAAKAATSDGHARAVAVAKRMLREAPVLPGASRRKAAPSRLLSGPPESGAARGLVTRSRYWVTAAGAKRAFHQLTAAPPAGYREVGSGDIGDRHGVTLRFVDDSLRRLPSGLASDDLIIAVSSRKDGKTGIGAYAETVPQPRRSVGEDVPASVTRVALSWTVSFTDRHALTRTIAGRQAGRFIAAFNAMQVSTLTGPIPCPESFGAIQSATFVGDGHTWVASSDNCGRIDVVRDGKALPALSDSNAYNRRLAHALGLDAPARKPNERVPSSVHAVTVKRAASAGTTTRTTHGSRATGLVVGFDDLDAIRPGVLSCTAAGTTYAVTFAAKQHTWVATMDPCHLISVTRDGAALPTLVDDGAWSQLVTQARRR